MPHINPLQTNLRSEDFDEILGTPPSWLIRSGSTIVFGFVLLFISLSYFIPYPDIITSEATLNAGQLPVSVATQTKGLITQINVREGDTVQSGALLATIHSLTNIADLLSLKEKLLAAQADKKLLYPLISEKTFSLGTLQPTFLRLNQALKDYQFWATQGFEAQKILLTEQKIQVLELLGDSLKAQEQTLKIELDLLQKDLERNKLLLKDGIVSRKDLENIQTQFLQKQREVRSAATFRLNNQISLNDLITQTTIIRHEAQRLSIEKNAALEKAFSDILSEIYEWETRHLLLAPTQGTVSLNPVAEPQQFVVEQQELFTIIPTNAATISANMKLPLAGSGRVAVGQRVRLSLEGFPFQEYGTIQGIVARISFIPRENAYDLIVNLPNPLITSYGKTLPFKSQMKAKAEIITQERRLIQRLIETFTARLKN